MTVKQDGFSLLEVLISVVILAIGMLGVAAMQTSAIRYNHSAELRSLAVTQISNIVDRMLANSQGMENGAYNSVSGIPSAPNCTNCTSAQVAQYDIHEWNSSNRDLLPAGQGTITRNANRYIITIRWDNNRSGVTGLGCSGNLEVDLACSTMEVQL